MYYPYESNSFANDDLIYVKYDSRNYYHVLIDLLPVLLKITRSYPEITFILHNQTLEILNRILLELGIRKINLESIDSIKNIDELKYINPLVGSDCRVLFAALDELRKNLTIQENLPKKIIIRRESGRAKNRQRNISKEIFDYIVSLGFTEIVCKNLSIIEQANIFYNAEIIVSPHGAELANMIFCKNGSKVIELNNGYNALLFHSYVKNTLMNYINNCLKTKKTTFRKEIIFDEKILIGKTFFKKTDLTSRYAKLFDLQLFEVGHGLYTLLKPPILTDEYAQEDFKYSLEPFKKIFTYFLDSK